MIHNSSVIPTNKSKFKEWEVSFCSENESNIIILCEYYFTLHTTVLGEFQFFHYTSGSFSPQMGNFNPTMEQKLRTNIHNHVFIVL